MGKSVGISAELLEKLKRALVGLMHGFHLLINFVLRIFPVVVLLDLVGVNLQLLALVRKSPHVCLQIVKGLSCKLFKELLDLVMLRLFSLQKFIVLHVIHF